MRLQNSERSNTGDKMNPILSPDKAATEKQDITRQPAKEGISRSDESLKLSGSNLPAKPTLLFLFTRISAFFKAINFRAGRFFTRFVDRKMYEYYFRRSLVISIIIFILSGPISNWFFGDKYAEAIEAPKEQELVDLSPRTLVVINAVPRTTLAQRRAKVPVIKEVDEVREEIEVPIPELGAVNIGPVSEGGEGSGEGGIGGGKLTYRRPELMMLVPPVYPKDAEKKRIEGSVQLRILVIEDGTVNKVEIITSSGSASLDDAAVKAAKRTRFRPGIKNGKRVAMWIEYPIQFALPQKKIQ
jgi:TonB family protein